MQPHATGAVAKWACTIGSVALALAAMYTLMGVLQALSLFTGERALRNVSLWGSLSLVCLFASAFLIAKALRLRFGPLTHKLAGILCSAMAVWSLSAVVKHELAVDRCLDQGGSFNYVHGVCDGSASHAALSLAVTHGFLLTLGGMACIAAALFFWSAHRARHHATSAL
jgi:hypothetical protein